MSSFDFNYEDQSWNLLTVSKDNGWEDFTTPMDLDSISVPFLYSLKPSEGLWLIGQAGTPSEENLYVITQAIGSVGITVETMLDIPQYLEEALELLTGFYLMNTLATSAEFAGAADNMYSRYIANIHAVQDRMLLRTYSDVVPTNESYYDKGWV